MFVFKSALEKVKEELKYQLADKEKQRNEYEHQLVLQKEITRNVKQDLEFEKRVQQLKIDEEVNKLRKEIQEKLITSDLLRNEALAKLEVYERLDTKADANVIKDTLKQLIEVVGKIQHKTEVIK